MSFDDLMVGFNISASGLAAERQRMEVVAGNIANAYSTRGPDGGPYRRQDLLFEAVVAKQFGRAGNFGLFGVQVVGVQEDQSENPRIYNPGHPDATDDGFVLMPNVQMPVEMVNLMSASRAYEANLRVLQTLRKQFEQVIGLLRA
jgi:flagellar basal-body rod protein FlgC